MPRDGASEESAAPAADVELELDSRAVGTAVRRVPLRVTVGLSTIATGTWFLWMGGETLACVAALRLVRARSTRRA